MNLLEALKDKNTLSSPIEPKSNRSYNGHKHVTSCINSHPRSSSHEIPYKCRLKTHRRHKPFGFLHQVRGGVAALLLI